MSQGLNSTIYVADLPVNIDKNGQPTTYVDEEFLRELFQDQKVIQSPDAIVIKSKIKQNGYPYSYAFIKFEDHESAEMAIDEMNYTKLDNIPMRLIMADNETKMIVRNNQGNLFIKNLDPAIEVSELHDAFSNFGEIISCKIACDIINVPCTDDPTQVEYKYISRGYGYIQFRNPNDAKQAMEDLKDASINGKPIEIQPFCRRQHKNPESTYNNCYIKNIPEHYDDDDIKRLLEEYGTPLSYKVIRDENGNNKGFGFCSMQNHEEAVQAVEGLNGKEIENLVIACGRAMSKLERLKEIQKRSDKWRKMNYEKYKGRNLYVKHFDENVTEEELKNIFSKFGNIETVTIMKDEYGKSKMFGFVCFSSPEEADKCIKESTLILIHDKQPYVAIAKTKDQILKDNLAKSQQRKMANNQLINNAQNTMNMFSNYQAEMFYNSAQLSNAQSVLIDPIIDTSELTNFRYFQGNEMFPNININFSGNYDTKSMLRCEIMEKYPNNSILLQRLRDISEDQAKELASNQQLFDQWMDQT